jgi:threonine-phosphate decarboxylase
MGMKRKQIHGGDIYRNPQVMDFSVNTNPLGPPAGVLKVVQTCAAQIVHYPDIWCEELVDAISKYERVEPEEVLCGNGAAELIYALVQAERPGKAILTAPSFAEYERALAGVGTEITYYECRETEEFCIRQDLVEMITEEYDMLVLCNPGNPTGQTIRKDQLLEIADQCQKCGITLVLDECFLDFLEDHALYEMTEVRDQYPNMIILKAFTKLFCMPGIRLGYAICAEQTRLQKMQDMLQPWNVSVLAQNCGIEALKDCDEYIKETKSYLTRERDYLKKELQKLENLKIQIYGSQANYLFFKGPEGLYERALAEGFLIRDCANYRGLGTGYYRISVRRHEENERLIAWLKRL